MIYFAYFFSRKLCELKLLDTTFNVPIRKQRPTKVTGLLDEIRKMIRRFRVPSKVDDNQCSHLPLFA